ncbi:IS1182 family transposase [Microvirga sp. Mcv34]|uniref:IS1182 family transposase n=1 Tax=Microvirga sp. Mcv34 TaxID=2926016 RepID=UPI0021C5EAC0|nr:IS1182 family transposase [Microvirga sp. Mcv34]
MSLHPIVSGEVPASTATVARAAFPRGNPYLLLRDRLGTIFTDAQFAPLFAHCGQPAECPWRLALVTLLQFAENLSDRRAADAVRSRIDWKYLLGLELTDPGFDASVLSEFRGRLVAGEAEEHLLDTLLTLCRDLKLVSARGRQRTDSTHVLGAVRSLNRLECVTETLRAALNALATAAPEWLRRQADPAWVERYRRRAGDGDVPQGEAKRRAHAEQIGRDGHQLLAAIMAPDAPIWLRQIPAVELLRQAWLQNFSIIDDAPAVGPEVAPLVRWRTDHEGFPPSLLMAGSPYDPEVHYAKKGTTTWIGYKVHLTEACDEGGPHLIMHVETTPAPVVDRHALNTIYEGLKAKGLLPDTHLVDAGYVAADQLVASRRNYGVTLLGPAPQNYQWQTQSGEGFTLQDFIFDWDRQVAICPAGHESRSWRPDYWQGRTAFKVRFSTTHCRPCPLKAQCTRSDRRLLTLRPQEEHETLAAAREREAQPAFKQDYQQGAGIEGTISAGVRVLHLRRSRYIGLAKTHLQHVLTAAMNLIRIAAWHGGTPLARTRQSAFTRLMMAPIPA